jgi:Uma2 family endonuclease
MATGRRPHRVAFRISRSLDDYAIQIGVGEAYADNIGFAVPELPSGRESFSPDSSYYSGPMPADPMRFIEGPPTLAVEVRSENDYGDAAEVEMAEKRADYFAAGTQVVWDVDTVAELIHVYRAADPTQRTTYPRGTIAEAEPAVPGGGWRWIGFSLDPMPSRKRSIVASGAKQRRGRNLLLGRFGIPHLPRIRWQGGTVHALPVVRWFAPRGIPPQRSETAGRRSNLDL